MKYRDVEYTVVQGLGRQLWKMAFVHDAKVQGGNAGTKAEAIREAEHAIEKKLVPKRLRLIPPYRF